MPATHRIQWTVLGLLALTTVVILVTHSLQAAPADSEPEQGGPDMEFRLTSTAFENGMPIPMKYSGEGVDVSPPLKWVKPPEGTRSFSLIADDPDAPMGTWVHWVLYNIPATQQDLPEGVPALDKLPDGSLQGVNDFKKVGYNGPMPPPGKPHRYFFKLYALDSTVDLPSRATKKQLEKAIKDHILAETRLMGTYKR